MPHYRQRSPVVSPARRWFDLAAKMMLAAGYGTLVVILPPALVPMLAVPIGIMLVTVLWMLPDRATYPLGLIEGLFPVFFAFSILWPAYLAVALPGLPWMTPTRLLLSILCFFMLYSIASSSVLRHHLLVVARSTKLVWLAFLVWEVMMVITVPMSNLMFDSFKRVVSSQLILVGPFFIGCLVFSKEGRATRTLGWMLVFAVICGIDGFIEQRLGYPPWANHIPSFMKVDDATLTNVLGSQARSADGLYRVRGPFTNSLSFSEFLALCVPFALHWLMTGRSVVLRLAMSVTLVFIILVMLQTQSRLGLVGYIVATLVYGGLWVLRRWRADKTDILGPALVLGFPVIAAVAVILLLSSPTLSTRILGGGAQAASDQARRNQRTLATPKIIANPIGHGMGRAASVINARNQSGYASIDNHYLSTLVDLGVVGFFSFYGMFLIAAFRGALAFLSTLHREIELAGPLATAMVVFFVIKSVLSQDDNHGLVFLLLGMLMTLIARHYGLISSAGKVVDLPPEAVREAPTPLPAATGAR